MASKLTSDDTRLIVDGLRVPRKVSVDSFRMGFQYEARSNDIFIVTYPHCGINWMAFIVYELSNDGQPFSFGMANYAKYIRFLERDALKLINRRKTRPKVIQTHYPFDRVPYNPKAKYICIIRQPKDVCNAMYHSLIEDSSIKTSVDFPTFFQLFIEGKTDYNDYFEHLRSIWSHKDDDNVLLVSYEQMKKDLRSIISQVAQFLQIDLTKNKELLDNVEKYASYEYVGRCFTSLVSNLLHEHGVELSNVNVGSAQTVDNQPSYMNEEQKKRLDKITATKTRDMTGIMAFWQP